MKKYKFKIGERVQYFINNDTTKDIDHRFLKIIDRKTIEDKKFYKCIYRDRKEEIFSPLISTYDLDKELELKLFKENYISEDSLYKENIKFEFDFPICGNSGCELLEKLLEEDVIDESEEDKEINKLDNLIKEYQENIRGYRNSINALYDCINNECEKIDRCKFQLSILLEDDDMYRSTFLASIED